MSIAEIETQAFSEFGVQPKNEDEKKPLSLGSTPFVFTPFAPKAAEPVKVVQKNDLSTLSISLDTNFTPSTPYVHKFRTEMCRNWQLYGKCKYGDECSYAHDKNMMMVKTEVSVNYKTKLCKKYSANGYCPYGVRCQFIHDQSEQTPQVQTKPPQVLDQEVVDANAPKPDKKGLTLTASSFFQPTAAPQQPVQQTIKGKSALGTKKTSDALAEQGVVYRDILLHCLNMSVQEYQKKMKMFQKKLMYRKRFIGQVQQPEIQYMNIYHTSERRLGCFKDICHEEAEETSIFNLDEDQDEDKQNNAGYFYGDATSYE